MSSGSLRADRIRDLNDAFRTGESLTGQWMLSRAVAALGAEFVALATREVRNFANFTLDNDPHGEHDFGALVIDGERVFWKIDYYDPTLRFGSADPSDSAVTLRVMTVMLAEDY